MRTAAEWRSARARSALASRACHSATLVPASSETTARPAAIVAAAWRRANFAMR
ncbi:MAG: hypothetical protein O9284_18345 [Steroidobacteraceae bacterium]|nr:hypothetical protein [Steroidobacteraceae bacterium]